MLRKQFPSAPPPSHSPSVPKSWLPSSPVPTDHDEMGNERFDARRTRHHHISASKKDKSNRKSTRTVERGSRRSRTSRHDCEVTKGHAPQQQNRDTTSGNDIRRNSFGSMFTQLRMLPRDRQSQSGISSNSSSDVGSTGPEKVTEKDVHSLVSISISPSALTNHQRNRNLHLIRSWTDSGHYSRVKAMTIASILYSRKVTEGDIRAELTPKEKFAYKKFCLEIEDKLDMITSREPKRTREPFSERTLRKIWHLFALYTKALSDEIWDEGTANSDIISRAIAYLVKRTIAGGPGDNDSSTAPARSSVSTPPTLKPVDPLESVNPVMASSLNDPIQAFLIVYGRFVSTGKVNQVERLRKLVHFNQIAEEFFQKLVEPLENVDIDTHLLRLRQRHQCSRKWSGSCLTGHGAGSNASMPYYSSSSQDWSSSRKDKMRSDRWDYRRNSRGDDSQNYDIHRNIDNDTSGGACPPSPIGNIPPPTETDVKRLQCKIQMLDGSKVCSVVSILPDPPIRSSTTSTLLAVSKRLASKEGETKNGGNNCSSNRPGTGTGDGNEGIIATPKRRLGLKNGSDKSAPLPSLKDLLCRSKTPERPVSVFYKELDEGARHILRGRFLPKDYVPATPPPSTSKNQFTRPRTPRVKRICLTGCRYEVLTQVSLSCGFDIVRETDLWNINWSDLPLVPDKIGQMRRVQDMYSLFWGLRAPLQKSNHFPGMHEICRKDRLGRNLNRLKKMHPKDYNFFPETFDLPAEQSDLIDYARRRRKNNVTFIIKPESGCQGKGIFLLRNLKKLNPFAKCVCQLYIPRPFLIDGYKFDQRIYVLITCVDPLRLYIYDEGIARFATVKYEVPTEDNMEVVYMHLTNYSLNKFSESYVREGDGSKRTLSSIYQWMSQNGYDVPRLVRSIDEIIIKSILSVAPTLKHNYQTSFPKRDRSSSCFELLGFDILIDRHLHPFLLEVNHSPSFNLDLPVDHQVKTALLKDLLCMIYLGDELAQQPLPVNSAAPSKRKKSTKCKNKKPKEEFHIPEGISEALKKQFKHEMKHRGRFRLIYSSDKPGPFQKLCKDDTYCGYNKMTTLTPQEKETMVFEREPDDYDEHQEQYRPSTVSSTVKITKGGQKCIVTRAVNPDGPQYAQTLREISGRTKEQSPRHQHKTKSKSKASYSTPITTNCPEVYNDKGPDQKHQRKRKQSRATTTAAKLVNSKCTIDDDDTINYTMKNNDCNNNSFAAPGNYNKIDHER